MKHETLYKFIGQTVLYFVIFLALLYFFSYLWSRVRWLYLQRILEKETLAVLNQPITDMIETIERYAQLQPDYPVYNVLGEENTMANWRLIQIAWLPISTKWDFWKVTQWSLVVKNMKC